MSEDIKILLLSVMVLLSGYLVGLVVDKYYGYRRERKYLDKLLQYILFGSLVYIVSYYLISTVDRNFKFNDYLLPLKYASWILPIISLSVAHIYGRLSKKEVDIFHLYHKKKFRGGWIVVHLKNGEKFWGKISVTDDDYEIDKHLISLKFVEQIDENYKVVKKLKSDNLVFNVKDIDLLEYKR